MLYYFLDLKKAFDTVKHTILLRKLQINGIRGTGLKWFVSYLSDRYQTVQLFYSNLKLIQNGVPQGF